MLQQRPDMQTDVFCALKFIGKLIDGNGLDKIFDKAGMPSLPNNLILEF